MVAAGRCPPKSPNSPDRWSFCMEHAGEYNRGWNYFEGLSAEGSRRARGGGGNADGGRICRPQTHYAWAGSGDGSRFARRDARAGSVAAPERCDVRGRPRGVAADGEASHIPMFGGDKDARDAVPGVQAAYEVLRGRGCTDVEAGVIRVLAGAGRAACSCAANVRRSSTAEFGDKRRTSLAKLLRTAFGVRGRKAVRRRRGQVPGGLPQKRCHVMIGGARPRALDAGAGRDRTARRRGDACAGLTPTICRPRQNCAEQRSAVSRIPAQIMFRMPCVRFER